MEYSKYQIITTFSLRDQGYINPLLILVYVKKNSLEFFFILVYFVSTSKLKQSRYQHLYICAIYVHLVYFNSFKNDKNTTKDVF